MLLVVETGARAAERDELVAVLKKHCAPVVAVTVRTGNAGIKIYTVAPVLVGSLLRDSHLTGAEVVAVSSIRTNQVASPFKPPKESAAAGLGFSVRLHRLRLPQSNFNPASLHVDLELWTESGWVRIGSSLTADTWPFAKCDSVWWDTLPEGLTLAEVGPGTSKRNYRLTLPQLKPGWYRLRPHLPLGGTISSAIFKKS